MSQTMVIPVPSPNGARIAQHGGLIDIDVRLTGVTPHLMNAMTVEVLLAMRDKVKKARNAAKPSLEDEAQGKLHLLSDGRPCIPVTMMMSCFIAAGQFIRLDGKRQIQERFEIWIQANPHVFELFRQFALQARAAGRKRYSADAIAHRLRWHINVEMQPVEGEEWRINDHFTSRLARRLVQVDPSFDGFFTLRDLKSA